MIKSDEAMLMAKLRDLTAAGDCINIYEIAEELDMNLKRAAYLCEKWSHSGHYEYGVNVFAGWLTSKPWGKTHD